MPRVLLSSLLCFLSTATQASTNGVAQVDQAQRAMQVLAELRKWTGLHLQLTTSAFDCAVLPRTGGGTSTMMFSTPLAFNLSIIASMLALYSHTFVLR
jgi:hypothetical protein